MQSLQRAFRVLEVMAASNIRLTCREISETIKLDRTITHRILRTLEVEGFAESDRGRYQLGARTLLLGNAYLDHLNLRRVALPHMLSLLHQETMAWRIATMSLFVPVGPYVTIAEQLWPPDTPLNIILRLGSRLPIDQTASGRCVLAFMPGDAVVHLIGADRSAELQERFESIRLANGIDYVGVGENQNLPWVAALSALIRDPFGRSVAALSVSGLGLESQLSRTSELALLLRRTADQIGLSLR